MQKPRLFSISLLLTVIAIPIMTLAIEWYDEGIFAALTSPHIHRLELAQWIPKLGHDLDAVTKWETYFSPDPYLYWYATTLGLLTLISPIVLIVLWIEAGRDGWRLQPHEVDSDEWPRSWKDQMAVAVGALFSLFWPWFGITFLEDRLLSLAPLAFHSIFMCGLLVCYGAALALGPVATKYVILNR